MENKFSLLMGKRVFVILTTGRKYSGIIKDTTENFLFILDKFNEKVVINISEISSLEEEK